MQEKFLLEMKPDWEEATRRWDHFWNGELYERPPLLAKATKKDYEEISFAGTFYSNPLQGKYQEQLDIIDRWLDSAEFLGEFIPQYPPCHGPDQWAAFFGGTLKSDENSLNTSWVDPVVEDWDEFLPLRFNEKSPAWQGVRKFTEMLARHGEGRYLVGGLDNHSHMDALSALRGPGNLCMDLFDCSGNLALAMEQIRPFYPYIFERLERLGRRGGEYGYAQHRWWCRQRYAVIQCDFIYMIGPEHFRRFVLPAIRDEAEYLEHSLFHLDGQGALTHLDDLLEVDAIDAIQWVPGTGGKPNYQWLDILKKCQAAGKAVDVYGGITLEVLKEIHRELNPAKVAYTVGVKDRDEFNRIDDWLRKNC